MITMGLEGRKWELFQVAVNLFAEKGYDATSMSQIAKKIGIRTSTIYYHFQSKEDILNTIFEYDRFAYETLLPILESAVQDAADLTKHPLEGLVKIQCHPDMETRIFRNKILAIAVALMHSNPRAEELVLRNLVEGCRTYSARILATLVELGRIEPLDIDCFIELHANHILASAIRGHCSRPISTQTWWDSLHYLFSMIRLRETPLQPLPVGQFYFGKEGWVAD